MNNENSMPQNKWHQASIGFLYPAILGSTIYGIIDFVFSESTKHVSFSIFNVCLALLIMLIYYLDMVLTSTPEIAEKYTKKLLFVEILLIFTMFPAVHSALGNTNFTALLLIPTALYMAANKSLCFIWECLHQRNDKTAKNINLLFLVLYLLTGTIALVFPQWGFWPTAVVVSFDFLTYVFFGEKFFVKRN